MTTLPRLKARTKITYPARVEGADGISVTKSNGVLTIRPDYGSIAPNQFLAGPTAGDESDAGFRFIVQADMPEITATDSTTGRSLAERFAEVANAKDFGATGDGVADDTAELQAMFNYARDNNCEWHIPEGDYLVSSSVTAYSSGKCQGRIIALNDSQSWLPVVVSYVDADKTDISLSTVNAWTGLVKGTTASSDFEDYYGHTVFMFSNDENIIERNASSGLKYQDAFVVHDPDGSIYPPVIATKSVATWSSATVSAVRNRENIVIEGLKVAFLSGTGEALGGIQVLRPNTTLISPSVVNTSSGKLQQGIQISYCSGVTVVAGYVEGAGENATNYAYNIGPAVGTLLVNCREIFCRRGVDNNIGKHTTVIGGEFPDGVGAHWADGLHIEGAYISSDSPGGGPVFVAGANVSVIRNTIKVRADSTALSAVTIRSDLFELAGALRVEDNDIEYDCSTLTSSERQVVYANANTSTHDWGRLVYMPDLVTIRGNRIKQTGGSFTSKIQLFHLFNSAPTPPDGIEAGGSVYIEGNSFDFDADILDGSGNPRIAVTTLKYPFLVSGGYTFHIADCPSLQIFAFCDASHSAPSDSRHDFICRNIGSLLWQANYGAFKRASLERVTQINEFGANRPSGYNTPIGDEYEIAIGPSGGIFSPRVDIASASATDLSACPSTTNVRITGTTTIAGFGAGKNGLIVQGYFQSALTLTASSTFLLNGGGSDITVAANDRFIARSMASSTWMVTVFRSSGKAIVPPAFSEVTSKPTTLSGYGITDAQPLDSDLTAIAALSTQSYGRGLLTYADEAAFKAGVNLEAGTDFPLKSQTAETISGYIETPSEKTYKLVVNIPHGATITDATTICESGTCTATFKINSTALGGTANSVSSSEVTQSHSTSNVAAAGDDIQLTVSSNSACIGLSFTLKYTRSLN